MLWSHRKHRFWRKKLAEKDTDSKVEAGTSCWNTLPFCGVDEAGDGAQEQQLRLESGYR